MGEDLLNSLLEEARNVKDKFQIIQWHTATKTNIQKKHLINNNNNNQKKKKKRPYKEAKHCMKMKHYQIALHKPTTPRELIKFF